MGELSDISALEIVKNAKSQDVIDLDTGYGSHIFRISCIVIKIHNTSYNHYGIEKRIYERLGFHPCILRFLGEVPPGCVLRKGLMFEYHELGSLAERIGTKSQDPQWPVNAMEAVRYIHSKGIIHGDIAARNFLVTDKNSLVLADFGGSSIDGSPCSVLPSIRYMAPSYIENVASGPTKKHDLFSLGTIFWEISTDEPFHFGRGNYMVKTIFLQRNFPTLGPQQDIYNLRVIVDKCWKELYNDAEEASRELHYEMIVR